jgi:hypothetical protein
MTPRASDDRGSTLPLIIGFFLIALVMVAGSIALGQAFVQQRDLQDVCDGAAAAAAASSVDLDRTAAASTDGSLRFDAVGTAVEQYLGRDPQRRTVTVQARLSPDRERITLRCTQSRDLPLGAFFGRSTVRHSATSSSRAAVVG